MSLGNVALGLASVILGVHHLRNGTKRLTASDEDVGLSTLALAKRPIDEKAFRLGRARTDTGYIQTPHGPMRTRTYTIRNLDDRIKVLRTLANEGKRDPRIMSFTRQVLSRKCGDGWCAAEKDNLAEARAIFKAVRQHVRYTSDIHGEDTYQKPGHTLALGTADCLPEGTLLLKQDGTLVPIEEVQEGDTVFDGSGWAAVTKWWDKGVQPLRQFELNNGSVLRCTDEHKLFQVPRGTANKPGTASDAREVVARDLDIGDELLQPREMSFGPDAVDWPYEKAFLLGAYLSEGCLRRHKKDGTQVVEIAGVPNGKGIREKVIECAEKLGLRAHELPRMVYLYGADFFQRVWNTRFEQTPSSFELEQGVR